MQQQMEERAGVARMDTVSDVALHAQYNGLVQDRIAHGRYSSAKTLVTSGFMLLVAIVLFGLHWRWLRRANGAPVPNAA